jgi:protocatechuate 3,4-dioxygenase beta subunit
MEGVPGTTRESLMVAYRRFWRRRHLHFEIFARRHVLAEAYRELFQTQTQVPSTQHPAPDSKNF